VDNGILSPIAGNRLTKLAQLYSTGYFKVTRFKKIKTGAADVGIGSSSWTEDKFLVVILGCQYIFLHTTEMCSKGN
jgi:hypothetical protein